MRHIYLDQNKWVALTRARAGRDEEAHLIEVLEAARDAVSAGNVSFPLSAQHYYETQHRGDRGSRGDLAQTMLSLSLDDAIAPPHVVVPHEIDVALINQLRLPDKPLPEIQIFGKGANHVFSTDSFTYTPPDELDGHRLSPELRAAAALAGSALVEFEVLAGWAFPESARHELSDYMRLAGSKFASGQEDLRDRIVGLGRGRLGGAMTAAAIVDILDPLLAACARLDIEPGRLFEGGMDGLDHLIQAMPSRWVEREMRKMRHSNPQKMWAGNDLNDVTALSVAMVYCDVVVTERQWTHFAGMARLDQRFGTIVISDLRMLPELLR